MAEQAEWNARVNSQFEGKQGKRCEMRGGPAHPFEHFRIKLLGTRDASMLENLVHRLQSGICSQGSAVRDLQSGICTPGIYSQGSAVRDVQWLVSDQIPSLEEVFIAQTRRGTFRVCSARSMTARACEPAGNRCCAQVAVRHK